MNASYAARRDALAARITALIEDLSGGARDDAARDALLRAVLAFQREHVPAYDRLVAQLAGSEPDPLRWPAVPTDVFRFTRVASHPEHEDARVFRTSGTTSGARGQHPLRELSLYDRAARAAARYALFPDRERMRLVVLAPPAAQAPDSSLSYMLSRFETWFGDGPAVCPLRDGALDRDVLVAALETAERTATPIALLGTSFAFVHAEDALDSRRFRLPDGSRIMQTGGFKGRSREVDRAEMLGLLAQRYGVPEPLIVQEYGMTELSSQCYESTLRAAVGGVPAGPRRFWAPGWVRVSVVDPERLTVLPDGAEGLARIDDLANLGSVCAIQTGDRARRLPNGFEILGRAPGATPRGCSLALDAMLADDATG